MSLYHYKVSISGGKIKSGRITAKTEKEARERLAAQMRIVEWHSITAVAPKVEAVEPEVQKPRPASKLAKMLYLQSGRCFFCGDLLKEEDASIEHLNPRSKGGPSTEDNEVVCHRSLNATFGDLDLKRKFEFVLKSAGKFQCPKN